MTITRRHALVTLGGSSFFALAGMKDLAFAATGGENRLVVVFLRGALDGLAAVPAFGDPDFETARNGIALAPPGEEGGALPLDASFGLNPLLESLHGFWQAGEMTVVHAIASPYRERSHFDAQNLVENGSAKPYGLPTGFLNRALVGLPAAGKEIGVSITSSMPVIMRGPAPVTSWSPSELPPPDEGIIARVTRLYENHPGLADAFEQAKSANAAMGENATGTQQFPALMRSAATFLKAPTGPRVAFVSSAGWDTHAGQSAEFGPLHQAMTGLDAGLASFREAIGEVWAKTVIVIVTEFGRTVAMNGSNGTDHGTGGVAFLAGGAVRGGRIIADWPGLKPADLHEGRDLKPTLDLRALFKGVLREHLAVADRRLESEVFPDSAAVKPLRDLFRA